jgi:rubrerythrin
VGQFFAEVARLEASAVHAFQIMARELAALGAPRRLERAARRAARDEVRHAKLTARLARRHGAEPRSPEVTPRPLRPLFELALENVVEGCVRETYGAACGRFQAARAGDACVRAELDRVARDEARHAELSWRIHAWAQQRLSRPERQALQRAARTAVADLRRELERDPGALVCEVTGMPAPEQALALLTALEAELWSPSGLAAAA